jgi:protein TonB
MTALLEAHEPEIQEKPKEGASLPKPPQLSFVAPPIFADVLLEVDSAEKKRRRWSALSSVVLQCVMLATALILPLMFTEALPKAQLLTYLVAPPPPPPPPAAAAPSVQVRRVESDLINGQLRSPSRIPQRVQMIKEDEAPPQINVGGVIGGVPGGIPGGQMNGVIGGIISSTSNITAVPKLAPVAPKRIRISQGVVKGMIIHKVEPPYPVLARQAHIQGDVVMSAIISKEGTIENLQVLSGHPLLVQAAIDAVKQWRYRPYMVSGEPVEVETKITATFRFAS